MAGNRRTVRMRSLCFRVLDMAECVVCETIQRDCEKLPIAIFRALLSLGHATELQLLGDCTKSALLIAIIELSGPGGLSGDLGQELLHTLASEVDLEMWSIEGIHAILRRIVMGRSTQAITMSIVRATCELIVGKARKLGVLAKPLDDSDIQNNSDEEDGCASRDSNTWNCFVREQTLGGMAWKSTADLS